MKTQEQIKQEIKEIEETQGRSTKINKNRLEVRKQALIWVLENGD